MANFHQRKSFQDMRRDSRRPERAPMHEATCANCGKKCLVPFIPTGNRPIYCKDCFKSEGGNTSRRADDRSRGDSDRPLFDAICSKCGNRCRIPFQPRPGKEVYCSHCFDTLGKDGKEDVATVRLQEQLDAINIKLGKILQLLSTKTPETGTLEPKAEAVTPKDTASTEKPVKKRATRKKSPASEE